MPPLLLLLLLLLWSARALDARSRDDMVPLSLGDVPPPPPPNSATVDTVETVFMWIIIVLDSVIFAVAFAWMVYLLWRKAGWNIRKLLSCTRSRSWCPRHIAHTLVW